jgi:hypothetical protein
MPRSMVAVSAVVGADGAGSADTLTCLVWVWDCLPLAVRVANCIHRRGRGCHAVSHDPVRSAWWGVARRAQSGPFERGADESGTGVNTLITTGS